MRSTLVAILLILLVPALVVLNASTWALRTVLDDVAFVSTVGRVMDTPALQEAIADRATAAIIETLDEAEGRLQVVTTVVLQLSGDPTREQIETALHGRILTVLDTPVVRQARDEAITAVHEYLMGGATNQPGLVRIQDSKVVLDLSQVVERAATAVDARLPQAGLADIDASPARIVLGDARQSRTVTSAISRLETLRMVIAISVLAMILATLSLAHRRTRALGAVGVAFMIAGLVSLVIAWVGGPMAAGLATDPIARTIASDAYDAFITVVIVQSLLLAAIGLLLALVAWIASRRGGTPDVPSGTAR